MVASNRDADINSLAKAILSSIMPGQMDVTLPVETVRFLLEDISANFQARHGNPEWRIKQVAEAETAKKAWLSSAAGDGR